MGKPDPFSFKHIFFIFTLKFMCWQSKMCLKPSEIFFSQDSINNVFDKNCGHSYKPIGETLDALCEGRCSVNSIPTISVVKHDNKWFTADNRRLWVFRNLERLGKCDKIYVAVGSYIPSSKFTTNNGGESVIVRNGSPGGFWHRRPSVKKPTPTPSIPMPKVPVLLKDENKENVVKICTIDENPTELPGRRPFQEIGSLVSNYNVIDETVSAHTEQDSDAVSTSSSLDQQEYLTSSGNSDKSPPQDRKTVGEVSSVVNDLDETVIELDIQPCQNAVYEDKNNSNFSLVTNPNKTLSDSNKTCKKLYIGISAIVIVILLSVLIPVLAIYT